MSAADEVKIALEKQKRRLALRQEFIKHTTDPHRHASGEGGTLVNKNIT